MPVQDTLEQTLFVVLLILDMVLLVISLFVLLEGLVEAKFHQWPLVPAGRSGQR